jgi:hypothetical protein
MKHCAATRSALDCQKEDTAMFWFIVFLALVALFLFWVSRKPDQFLLSRSIDINATPEAIFPEINNLKAMNSWNPFAADDPKTSISYSGPEAGTGATYTWAGGKSGSGKFQILEATPFSAVNCRLEMLKPIAADNRVTFTLTPGTSGATNVSWTMAGPNAFIHKLLHTFMNMDKMVGGTFDKGLAALKAKVEQKKLP